MDPSLTLTVAAFDSLSAHVAVLDDEANVVLWNRAWDRFAAGNGAKDTDWRRFNYRDVCQMAADDGDEFALLIADTLSQTLAGSPERRIFEYPCHSPTEERFFQMTVSPLDIAGRRYALVEHEEVTGRRNGNGHGI